MGGNSGCPVTIGGCVRGTDSVVVVVAIEPTEELEDTTLVDVDNSELIDDMADVWTLKRTLKNISFNSL